MKRLLPRLFAALAAVVLLAAPMARAANNLASREIVVTDMHFADGKCVSIDLSLEPIYCATGTLYAAFADADMGDDLADWPNREVAAATVTERDISLSYAIPPSWGDAGYRFLRFFLVSSVLKGGEYAALLEYVESSNLSYVDTGLKTTRGSRVESRFMRITDDSQIILYGSGGQTLTAWLGSDAGHNWRFNGQAVTPRATVKNAWYDFVQSSKAVVAVCDGGTPEVSRYGDMADFTSSSNLSLFRNGTDSSSSKPLRVGYFRHYTNDVLATSLVPVRFSGGTTVGFWNLVTDSAVECVGLTAGPVVNCGDSITNATAEALSYLNGVSSTTGSREIAIAATHATGGVVTSIDVSLEPMFRAVGTLYAAFAGSDMGDGLADWTHVAKVADVTESDTLVTYSLPAEWGSAGYRALRFFLVSSLLKNYDFAARLEYVDSSASSDIDTYIKPNARSRFETGVMRITDDQQIAVHGCGQYEFALWLGSSTKISGRFAGQSPSSSLTEARDIWYYITQSSTGLSYVDGNGMTGSATYSGVNPSWTGSQTTHLFNTGTDSSFRKPLRMSYWRHYTNDVIATSLVPVLFSDGATAGFWDLATDSAVECAGLTAGPAIGYGASITNVTADLVEYSDAPSFVSVGLCGDAGNVLVATGAVSVAYGELSQVAVTMEFSTDETFAAFSRLATTCDAQGLFGFEATGITPGATYWCRFIATGVDGSVATNDAVSITMRGHSAIDATVVVSSSQRQLAFSGTLSTNGVAPTYVLLQCGGETRATATAAADGSWSIAWDATSGLAWTSSPVAYTLVCSNECGEAVFTSSLGGTFTLNDAASYTWKGGAVGNWGDSGNWTSSMADSLGYPCLADSSAVFPDGTTANIALDCDVNIANYAVGASNVNVAVTAADAHAFAAQNYFLSGLADTGVKASTYVFGGPIALTNLTAIGMGSILRLENGVRAYSARGLKLRNPVQLASYDSKFEIRSGSTATFDNGKSYDISELSADTEIVVNDATLETGCLVFNVNNVPGGTIRLEGESPLVRVSLLLRSAIGTATGTGGFVFSVPSGGYKAAPVQFTGDSGFGGYAPMLWQIDPNSPAMSIGRCSTPLIESKAPIDTTLNTFVQPRGVKDWTVVIDNAPSTKTATASWMKPGFTLFVR